MITSKGVAGVPRATLVILMGTAASFGLPEWPILAILGIDELMDMARTSVNVIGNCLATVVIARWEGEFPPKGDAARPRSRVSRDRRPRTSRGDTEVNSCAKTASLLLVLAGAAVSLAAAEPVRLITLDPGHFHAGLLQKEMYPGVDPTVHVYAPVGPDLVAHLGRISAFNNRAERPTSWKLEVHAGPDFVERMLREKPGNVVVLSGRNKGKMDRIEACVGAGLNVLADKPWLIEAADFPKLEATLAAADAKGLVAYDVMTERYEITTILQKELVGRPRGRGHDRPGDGGGAGDRDGERPPHHEGGGGRAEPPAGVVLRHRGAGRGARRRGDPPRGPRAVRAVPGPADRLQGGRPRAGRRDGGRRPSRAPSFCASPARRSCRCRSPRA